jgi:hypothetical protein
MLVQAGVDRPRTTTLNQLKFPSEYEGLGRKRIEKTRIIECRNQLVGR